MLSFPPTTLFAPNKMAARKEQSNEYTKKADALTTQFDEFIIIENLLRLAGLVKADSFLLEELFKIEDELDNLCQDDPEYNDLYCPITSEIIQNPVKITTIDANNRTYFHYYEKKAIEMHLEKSKLNPANNLMVEKIEDDPIKEAEIISFLFHKSIAIALRDRQDKLLKKLHEVTILYIDKTLGSNSKKATCDKSKPIKYQQQGLIHYQTAKIANINKNEYSQPHEEKKFTKLYNNVTTAIAAITTFFSTLQINIVSFFYIKQKNNQNLSSKNSDVSTLEQQPLKNQCFSM